MDTLYGSYLPSISSRLLGYKKQYADLSAPQTAIFSSLTSDQVRFQHRQQNKTLQFGSNLPQETRSCVMFPDASKFVEAYWQKVSQCDTPDALAALLNKLCPSDSLCKVFEAQYHAQDSNGKIFIGLLTHELSAQSSLIRYALWNLEEEPLTIQEAQNMMKNCLDGLVQTVQTYQRFFDENMMTTQSPFASVFSRAIERLKPLADEKNIELRIENTLSPDSKLFVSDFRADAMVWNLVQNAVKYSPVGSVVTVNLSAQETPKGLGVQLKVTDSGIGILPEDQERVLEGYRGKNAEEVGIPGTGFGLSDVAKHIRYAHGTLTLQSPVNPANLAFPGTSFTAILPVAKN